MSICRAAAALTFATLLCVPALAASSDVFKTEGGSLRLVTSGLAGPDGLLRGVLEISLDPGWKTYWRDPGAAGVPPQIELGKSINVSSTKIDFPAPRWHDDGYGAWAGYDRPVRFPVSFTIPKPDRYSLIEADVFVGLCQTICVPAQARLTVEPGGDPDNAENAALVDAAFAALPRPARQDFGVAGVTDKGDMLAVEAALPGDGDAQFFAAAPEGFAFGAPKRETDGARTTFLVPVSERPKQAPSQMTIPYTLVLGSEAVSGEMQVP